MRILWSRRRSYIVTLVYFNDAKFRTREHVDHLIAYFLRKHWTRKGRDLECDVLRAIAASFRERPELICKQIEIDRKIASWLLSQSEDRREAAMYYRAQQFHEFGGPKA